MFTFSTPNMHLHTHTTHMAHDTRHTFTHTLTHSHTLHGSLYVSTSPRFARTDAAVYIFASFLHAHLCRYPRSTLGIVFAIIFVSRMYRSYQHGLWPFASHKAPSVEVSCGVMHTSLVTWDVWPHGVHITWDMWRYDVYGTWDICSPKF